MEKPVRAIALIPAYNASQTIRGVLASIPHPPIDQTVVVDDGSSDSTAQLVQGVDHTVLLRHTSNRGYGAAQKTVLRFARDHEAQCSVILHADGGHFPNEIPLLLDPLFRGDVDVVVGSRVQGIFKSVRPFLGSRFLGATLWGPMPGYKFIANRILSRIQNLLFGTHFTDFHSGFRAVTRDALRRVPFEQFGNWYLFDTEFMVASSRAGLRVREVPVGTYYSPKAGSRVPSIRYGFAILRFSFQDWLRRHFKRKRSVPSQPASP